jgi:hypothetical protein
MTIAAECGMVDVIAGATGTPGGVADLEATMHALCHIPRVRRTTDRQGRPA